jgi:hypothetical protein
MKKGKKSFGNRRADPVEDGLKEDEPENIDTNPLGRRKHVPKDDGLGDDLPPPDEPPIYYQRLPKGAQIPIIIDDVPLTQKSDIKPVDSSLDSLDCKLLIEPTDSPSYDIFDMIKGAPKIIVISGNRQIPEEFGGENRHIPKLPNYLKMYEHRNQKSGPTFYERIKQIFPNFGKLKRKSKEPDVNAETYSPDKSASTDKKELFSGFSIMDLYHEYIELPSRQSCEIPGYEAKTNAPPAEQVIQSPKQRKDESLKPKKERLEKIVAGFESLFSYNKTFNNISEYYSAKTTETPSQETETNVSLYTRFTQNLKKGRDGVLELGKKHGEKLLENIVNRAKSVRSNKSAKPETYMRDYSNKIIESQDEKISKSSRNSSIAISLIAAASLSAVLLYSPLNQVIKDTATFFNPQKIVQLYTSEQKKAPDKQQKNKVAPTPDNTQEKEKRALPDTTIPSQKIEKSKVYTLKIDDATAIQLVPNVNEITTADYLSAARQKGLTGIYKLITNKKAVNADYRHAIDYLAKIAGKPYGIKHEDKKWEKIHALPVNRNNELDDRLSVEQTKKLVKELKSQIITLESNASKPEKSKLQKNSAIRYVITGLPDLTGTITVENGIPTGVALQDIKQQNQASKIADYAPLEERVMLSSNAERNDDGCVLYLNNPSLGYSKDDLNAIINIVNNYNGRSFDKIANAINAKTTIKLADNNIEDLLKEIISLKATNLYYKDLKRVNFNRNLASKKMMADMKEMYFNSDKSLKKISEELGKEFYMNPSEKTISKYAKMDFNGLNVKSRAEAKMYAAAMNRNLAA